MSAVLPLEIYHEGVVDGKEAMAEEAPLHSRVEAIDAGENESESAQL